MGSPSGPKRQELTGILERFTPKGAIISDRLFIWSKWMKGERPDESHIGCELRVLAEPVEGGADRFYVRQVLSIGGKAASGGASSPGSGRPSSGRPSGAGGYRRFSPEELALKKDEGVRIARSVAIDRAIDLARHGIPIDQVGVTAAEIEKYLLTGEVPSAVPSATSPATPTNGKKRGGGKGRSPSAPSKVESRRINELFNLARKAKVVVSFGEFQILCKDLLGEAYTDAYALAPEAFDRVQEHIRASLPGRGPGRAAS